MADRIGRNSATAQNGQQDDVPGVMRPPVLRDRPAGAPSARLHDNIARGIGIRIAAETLKPGDLLPGEIEAAEQFSVSRTAYREAVRILAAKGMVESRTKTGTRISPRARWHILDPEVIGWFLETKPSEAFVRDLFGVRQMVEPHAAALAATHHTRRDLDAMTEALDTMARLQLATEEGRAADRAFHQAILAATGNELISALSPTVAAAIWWTTLFKSRTQQEPRDPLPEHYAVLNAIRSREPERAREAMVELVGFAFDDMQLSLSTDGDRLTRG
ncbi:FadR family transcriptional regulator [Acetobacteraceae bacterium KSS8]|uniref:FadR family transcriptional regulator n=1 Tax=Endosaccharibacter trunci TaxID=2812733 RepID=A0ABT1W5N4_9PROT|nr:FadR family transcriptional regulator [Acetobacteraceae bacterium KSS8]